MFDKLEYDDMWLGDVNNIVEGTGGMPTRSPESNSKSVGSISPDNIS